MQAVSASLLLCAVAAAEQASDYIKIQTFKTHSRLSLRLDASVEVERQRTAAESTQGFEILLKGLALTDLGAPFGSEGEWLRQMDAVTEGDGRLLKVKFRETEAGVVVKGSWKFPGGKAALADPRMETFHYRKDNAYVVDFWTKPGPTAVQAKASSERRAKEDRLRKVQAEVKARQDRRVALTAARAEMEDSMRFCKEPWTDSREVFLPFAPARSAFSFDRHLPQKQPDQDYPYSSPQGNSEESQYFRLALRLYRKEKYALVQKTLDFFDRKFKDSVLADEVRFLRANSMLKMGLEEAGISALKQLVATSRKSPAALQSSLFLAQRTVKSGDALGAFEQFMGLTQSHPEHRLNWVFHMGVAESLASLRQTGKAVQEYRWVMENAPDRRSQAEGAARIGDLFLERRQYDQALASYFLAIQEYSRELDRFPSFWINRAEALYWLGQYDRAAAAYSDFLERFGAHNSAWRATYRLSEIEGRAGNEKKAQKLLVDTINRYPYSPGAQLARARSMSCEPSQRPSEGAIRTFFDAEFAKFDGGGQVLMERFADYRGLAYVRALLASGSEDSAIEVALSELDGRGDSKAKQAVAQMLEHLFRRSILKKLGTTPTDDSRLAALSFFHEFGHRVPHFPGNVDADYLLKLSQAAIDLGMTSWGQEIGKVHQSRAGSDRVVASSGEGSIDRRLLESEKAFTEARALWVEKGLGVLKDQGQHSRLRELLLKVVEESPFSYERELVSALMESGSDRPALALTHLLKAQALAPAAERNSPRILALLARLQSESGNANASAATYAQLVSQKPEAAADSERLAALRLPAPPARQALTLLYVEQLTKLARWGEIARILSEQEEAGALNSPLRYEFARALSRTGTAKDKSKSTKLLQGLAEGAPEEFWKNLAREALNQPEVNAKEGRRQ